ncbi:hypothetical protein LJJ44_01565 [Pseudomonas sp. B24_DOA]|nr:hypothetical protein LJJ44_01565 [Pseudomonas sp. B24_DOA]WKV90396.1 hypothetical protein LJU32_09600 [Pseudomonas sp. B21_DOA]
MPLQLAFQGSAFHLPLSNGQKGAAPEHIAFAGWTLEFGFDFVGIALANPDPGDRACDILRGEVADIDTLRTFEACRSGKFCIEETDPVGIAVTIQLGVGQRLGVNAGMIDIGE